MDNYKAQHKSLWIDTINEIPYLSLTWNAQVDVVIIWWWITWITAAYLLAQKEKSIVVIDSGKIWHWVTWHTTAKITSLHWAIYKYLIDTFWKDKAQAYALSNQAWIEKISQIVHNENILCDFSYQNMYLYAENINEIKIIQQEYEATQAIWLESKLVYETDLPFKTNAALCFENQAQFHPLLYLRQMAMILKAKGISIFENTRAIDIEHWETCRVITTKWIIQAKNVIIATHYPFLDWPWKYFSRMYPSRGYAIAARNNFRYQGMYISSSEKNYSIRFHKDWIVIWWESHRTGEWEDMKKNYENLLRYASEHFEIDTIDYYWSTQDNYTVDKIPYIWNINNDMKNIYIGTWYNWWWMSTWTLAGMLISDMILGNKNSWNELYDPNRKDLLASAKTFLEHNLEVAKRYIADKWKKWESINIWTNEWKIIEYEWEKIWVYKDNNNNIHAVWLKCTHMGCNVNRNNAENTWDCPCHGSRYNYDGKVIQWPATKDLEQKDIIL